MTNDDLDLDDLPPEGGGKEETPKASLQEAWNSNPMLKIAAVVMGVVVLIGGYMIFASNAEDNSKAMIHMNDASNIKQVPGQQELDPAYRKALEETNKKEADAAAEMGGSALPTPIGTAKVGGLDMPEMPEKPKTDPLAEWRKATETRRMNIEKDVVEEDNGAPPPEIVPMAQPIRPQQQLRMDPNASRQLAEQMRVIIGAQMPQNAKNLDITKRSSPYYDLVTNQAHLKEVQTAAGGTLVASAGKNSDGTPCDGENCDEASSKTAPGTDSGKSEPKPIVTAGTIAYAQLLMELNSDIEGPVMAQVLSGPFEGARAIGKVETKDEYMVITFDRIIKDAVSYAVNSIALDEHTTLAAHATDIDHHYFARVILPAAAKFVEGYGSAVAQTGTTTQQTSGGGQSTSTPKPTPKESLYKGLEESTKKVSEMLQKGAERPITVKVAKGTTMGILFLDTVTTEDAGK